MLIELIKPLFVNYAILFSFIVSGNVFYKYREQQNPAITQQIFFGLFGSVVACIGMFFPIEVLGETRWDFRFIVIILLTLYAGNLSGLIALVLIVIFRHNLSEEFLLPALLLSVFSYLSAVVLRGKFLNSSNRLLFSINVFLLYFACSIVINIYYLDFLPMEFYLVYYSLFLVTFVTMVFVIQKLIAYNRRMDEVVYMDALKTIGHMSAAFAHEIRNPLTTIRGFMQYLSEGDNHKQLPSFAPLILDELDRTNKIITDYIALSKPPELNKMKLVIEDIVQDTVNLVTPLANYRDVKIIFQAGKTSNKIVSDPNYLKQVMVNLINNAIEAMEFKNGGEVQVEVIRENQKLNIIVTDNGVGMTKAELENIGLIYYTTKSKGTGLGTMVVNKLVSELNGKINYQSEKGQWTKVRVILPMED